MKTKKGIRRPGIYFRAYGTNRGKTYPAWRYHKHLDAIVVNDTAQDIEAQEQGYEHLDVITKSNPHLLNYMADLEDLSARQLARYAKEEFGVDLPPEAGEEKLRESIRALTVFSPKNRDRIVLLAQSVKMNYDETVAEIRNLAKDFEEVETEVFYG